MARLWRNDANFKGCKYMVLRRDNTVPEWPWFVLGARDPAAPAALLAYADECERLGKDPAYVADIRTEAMRFASWVTDHGQGDPDAPRHRKDDPSVVARMPDWSDESAASGPARERLSAVELAGVYEHARRSGPRPGQLFRHKGTGGVYEAICVALMEATLEPAVVYRTLFPGTDGNRPTFSRPLAEWREKFVDASGPGRGDPGENGVNPAADAMASPAREAEPTELSKDADGAPLPTVEMIARAFSGTIFWNDLTPWPGDANKEPEHPLEALRPVPPRYASICKNLFSDGEATLLRFASGELDVDVALLPPQGDDADFGNVTSYADADFVAKLPVYVPILLAEIDRLRAKMVTDPIPSPNPDRQESQKQWRD